MSPVPPNSNGKHLLNNSELKNFNENQANQQSEDSEFEIIEEEENNSGSVGVGPNSREYSELTQNPANNEEDADDDDDEDGESDEDDDIEIHQDVELGFELLASSRAFLNEQQNSNQNQNLPGNLNYFEMDFFERKNTLEPEEIVLDEDKSKKICDLMSAFKLPDKCVPEWAKEIPENVWKKNLIDSINAKKTDLFQLKEEENKSQN